MKSTLFFLLLILLSKTIVYAESPRIHGEKHEIIEREPYVYFGPDICSMTDDLPFIHSLAIGNTVSLENLSSICECIAVGQATAPLHIMQAALQEAETCLDIHTSMLSDDAIQQLLNNLEAYQEKIDEIENAPCPEMRTPYKKFTNMLVHDKLSAGSLFVAGDTIIRGNKTLLGMLITPSLQSGGSLTIIGTPQQACIIFRDAALVEKARICSSPIPGDKGVFVSVDGGVTQNVRINNEGGTVIATPSSGLALNVNGATVIAKPATGESLTVNGNIVLPQADAAGTQGLFEFGGANPNGTNVELYEFGTRNLFAGNYTAPNALVSGADNISIGTNANSTLRTATATIAIGTAAIATGTDSIVIGTGANTLLARDIIIGSRDSTSTGAAPTTLVNNAIAIGSASGTLRGALAGALATSFSAIALGGSDGVFNGAGGGTMRSIGIGAGSNSSNFSTMAIGSASGTIGGLGPATDEITALAIGSANGALRGARGLNTSSIAIGGSDGVFVGALGTGVRSVNIGVNATSAGAVGIAIGSASGIAGGIGATAGTANGIAIGSAQDGRRGANPVGAAAIAVGSADSAFVGASTTLARAVAIGAGARCTATDQIALGATVVTNTAVKVGIGIASPAAKLDIVGDGVTFVMRCNAGSTAAASQPTWLNRFTSAVAGTPLHFNASGQLFGFTSSKRYKTNIRSIGSYSEIIYQLHPVVYDAQEGHGEGENIPGFIAEEMYEVAPHLTILNENNTPENVAYNSLHALAIKELQKQQILLEDQKEVFATQKQNILQCVHMLKKLDARVQNIRRHVTD